MKDPSRRAQSKQELQDKVQDLANELNRKVDDSRRSTDRALQELDQLSKKDPSKIADLMEASTVLGGAKPQLAQDSPADYSLLKKAGYSDINIEMMDVTDTLDSTLNVLKKNPPK